MIDRKVWNDKRGQPLPTGLRDRCERFFGRDLSAVRPHDDPVSRGLAACLKARAFTYGSDIFFAGPQPSFSTVAGLRLLVHELAHVCQQSAASEAVFAVGAPDDCREVEAQKSCQAFLAGEPAPALTADTRLTVRRAPAIDPASAKITVNGSMAKPAVKPSGNVVVCHLTNNFFSVNKVGPAFTAEGEVGFSGLGTELLAASAFGFIQFQKIKNISVTYSTPAIPERILLDCIPFHNPALDSDDSVTPFTRTKNTAIKGSKVVCTTADHPLGKWRTSLVNRTSSREDMLTSVTDSREFWTALVAKDQTGIQYLAHFHWELFYSFFFEWELTDLGEMRLKLVLDTGSSISFDDPVPGPPTAAEVQPMLADPRPPQANETMNEQIVETILGGPPKRLDRDF